MSIYQAIANPMVPNIAQAVMQGQQTRLQQEQATQNREQFELQQQLLGQQVEMGALQLDAARNPMQDFKTQLEQEQARATMATRAAAVLDTTDDPAQRARLYAEVVAPVWRQLYRDQEISDEYNEDDVAFSRQRFVALAPTLDAMSKAADEASLLISRGRPKEAQAVMDAARTQLEQQQSAQRAEMLQDPATGRIVVPQNQAEYTRLTQQGYIPKTPVQSQEVIQQRAPAGSEEFVRALAKSDADRVTEILERGEAATSNRAALEQIQIAIDTGRFRTGSLGEVRQAVSQFAELIGLQPENIGLGLGDPATADIIDAASKQIGVTIAERMSRLTNMSLRFIEGALPNLTRTPTGNRALIRMLDRLAEREQAVAALTDDYVSRYEAIRGVPGVPSLQQMIRQMDEENPIIDAELRRTIEQASTAGRNIALGLAEETPVGQRKLGDVYRNRLGRYARWTVSGWVETDELGNPVGQ
jgi:hypothetical protein